MNRATFIGSLVVITLLSLPVRAQENQVELDRQALEDNPKAYCTPILGQAVDRGAIVTVPVGHDCSSWLNYMSQQEILQKNSELRRYEVETNGKLQLYLNVIPRW
jgi:hypothetical protein